ncbi:2-oxoacid:ferredoxin oxidoreductase subunit beta [Candidatus Woesearchaeota archaeon]|nr:2-oxoacid:ferredoxin oxidoreductase subunit beta [Candidatus Woesearchaeota archaeon]
MIKKECLDTGIKPNWCPGCGNFGIWLALKQALTELDIKHEEVVVVCGIGCHGHMCNFVKTYSFEGLHGRPIPVAEGVKLANKGLKVIVVAGDGDTYGEGLNHFLMGVRGNHDITLLVHDNMIYGLTTGQTSPTSEKGRVSKSTPTGSIEVPVNPIALAIAQEGSFVARSWSADPKQLVGLIKAGITHRGFAHIDVLQNCATFNKINTVTWFKEHIYKLDEAGHDPTNREKAMLKALDLTKLGTGIFYQDKREAYDEGVPAEKGKALIDHDLENIDLTESYTQFV